MGETPFDPESGRYLPLDPFANLELKEMTITDIGTNRDYLECEDEEGRTQYVAKPYLLRQTPFDGETINDVLYTYTTANERVASDESTPVADQEPDETQVITPSYYIDEIILVVNRDTGVEIDNSGERNDGKGIGFEEVGYGRAWAVVIGP